MTAFYNELLMTDEEYSVNFKKKSVWMPKASGRLTKLTAKADLIVD